MLRRSFFSRIGGAAAALGLVDQKAADAAPATPAAPGGSFTPARHEQDNWFDELPGTHRVVFDTWTPTRFPDSLQFAGNIYRANRDGYGLTEKDLAVIICVRHNTAPFAFNDAMWAKYTASIAERSGFTDPKTKEPAKINALMATGYGGQLTNLGVTLDSVLKRGLRLGVCQLATRALVQNIVGKTGGNADDIYKELTSNLVSPNAHMVPAGIIAVNRAQERGFTFAYVD